MESKVLRRELKERSEWLNPAKLNPWKLSFGTATNTIITSMIIYACQLYFGQGLTRSLVQVSLIQALPEGLVTK